MPPRSLGYQPSLDGLRGLAVTAVIGYHLHYCSGGSSGVTLFFTLSGFLITCLLIEEFDRAGRISLRNFYLRRGLRLLPALVAVLTVDVIFVLSTRSGWQLKADLASAAVTFGYVSNWVQAYRLLPLNQLGHTWSLAVEEQFYLMWPPLLLLLIARLRLSGARLAFWIAVAAACFTLERFVLASAGSSMLRLYNGLDTRADGLLLGAAAAVAFRYRLLERWPTLERAVGPVGALAFVGLLLHTFLGLGAEPRSTSPTSLGTHTVVAQLTAVTILALNSKDEWLGGRMLHAFLRFEPLQYLGRISYGLYLWHYLLFVMLDEARLDIPEWSLALLKCGATLGVATVSYYALERPCLRLKNRFGPLQREGHEPSRKPAPYGEPSLIARIQG
jgi:peptidoglycan/LPS O-acetylase OafA/YrhL